MPSELGRLGAHPSLSGDRSLGRKSRWSVHTCPVVCPVDREVIKLISGESAQYGQGPEFKFFNGGKRFSRVYRVSVAFGWT